jgi:hypothetical protein
VDDDVKWRGVLRGLNARFRHQTVMGAQIERFMSEQSGVNLRRVFDQYLRTAKVPVLEYRLAGDTLVYRWTDVVPGFDMPVRATLDWPTLGWLRPSTSWQRVRVKLANPSDFRVDPDFYVVARRVEDAATR